MNITSVIKRWRYRQGVMPINASSILIGMLCLSALSMLNVPRAWGAPILQAVDVGNLPGGRVQLRFQLSEPVNDPRSFTINDPARIVVDFMGAQSGLTENQREINQGAAEQVTVLEGGDRTRAAVNLTKMVPYDIRSQGNTVLLTLEAGGNTVSSRPQAAPVANAVTRSTAKNGQLSAIDFRRGVQGQGIINMTLSSSTISVDVREEQGNIVADFVGAKLPRGQERRLDVTDFATPVTLIDAFNRGENARLVIQRVGESEFLAYQTDDRYIIEVNPVAEEEVTGGPGQQKIYTGELLSLNFQDIEVRAVLQIIADFTGLNVVVSDTVQGNLTLRLQNVPWDQALDIILQTKGLTQRQNGNVIYIAPAEEVAAREKLELEALKAKEELEPLVSDTIQVNYAKVEDIKNIIEERRGANEDSDSFSLLSSRGTVSFDPRTNLLIVVDVPSKLPPIRELIQKIDIPVRQVLIDSRIVIANDDFSKELGVRWGFSGVRSTSDNGLAAISGSAGGNETIIGSAIGNLTDTGQPFPVEVPALADRLGVDLGVGGTSRLALALLGQDYLVDLELSALQAEGRGEVLSNPRVITTDRNEASIIQGQKVPFNTLDEAGNTVTDFEDVNLELTVTPQITPDGRVILDLEVKKDEIVGTAPNGELILGNREVKTQAMVDDGETVVLGGVFEKVTRNNVDKVPFLGDLPAVGSLFRRNQQENTKLELLIFVTPQVIQSGGIQVR